MAIEIVMAEHREDEGRGTSRAGSMRLLRQIADALGKPVSEFVGPDTDGIRLTELMHLWQRLSASERDTTLREMRARAEGSGGATPELKAVADKDA